MKLKVKMRELKKITKWTLEDEHTGELVASGSCINSDVALEDARKAATKYRERALTLSVDSRRVDV